MRFFSFCGISSCVRAWRCCPSAVMSTPVFLGHGEDPVTRLFLFADMMLVYPDKTVTLASWKNQRPIE